MFRGLFKKVPRKSKWVYLIVYHCREWTCRIDRYARNDSYNFMTFEEYQKLSRETAVYPNKDNNFIYPVLGLAGEAGEVAEKIKKVLRDDNGVITDQKREDVKKELGDVLWYIAQVATELNMLLEDVASHNIEKLFLRKERGQLHGDGDNR